MSESTKIYFEVDGKTIGMATSFEITQRRDPIFEIGSRHPAAYVQRERCIEVSRVILNAETLVDSFFSATNLINSQEEFYIIVERTGGKKSTIGPWRMEGLNSFYSSGGHIIIDSIKGFSCGSAGVIDLERQISYDQNYDDWFDEEDDEWEVGSPNV